MAGLQLAAQHGADEEDEEAAAAGDDEHDLSAVVSPVAAAVMQVKSAIAVLCTCVWALAIAMHELGPRAKSFKFIHGLGQAQVVYRVTIPGNITWPTVFAMLCKAQVSSHATQGFNIALVWRVAHVCCRVQSQGTRPAGARMEHPAHLGVSHSIGLANTYLGRPRVPSMGWKEESVLKLTRTRAWPSSSAGPPAGA